jgi:signal transduction histidine kinase
VFEPVSGELGPTYDLQTALEASCGVLMLLETIRRDGEQSAGAVARVQAHLQQSIESVRRSITQLRMARSEMVSPMALGFVVASPLDRRSQRTEPGSRP